MVGDHLAQSTTIVTIGTGFIGAMTAVNLLRNAPSRRLRVVLVNKSGRMARGSPMAHDFAASILGISHD